MAQYQAGYFIEGIKKLFLKDKDFEKIEGILNQLSYFNLETDKKLKKTVNDSILSVFNNIISRGLPTIPSTFIEDFISATFSVTRKKICEDNNLEYNFLNDDYKKNIFRALHIIDPRITKKHFEKRKSRSKKLKNELKNQFLFDVVPVYFGEYLLQLFEYDRDIETIAHFSNDLKQNIEDLKAIGTYDFLENTCDITIELPFVEKEQKGLIISLDDNSGIDNTDYKIEERKKEFLKKINWNYETKINKDDFQDIEKSIEQLSFFTFNSYFDNLKKNFTNPLYKDEDGLNALQLALSPLGVARIQKTILEFIFSGHLDLNSKEWKIAVIERDVPCAFLAIEDFKHNINKLFLLEGKGRKLPKIKLALFYSEEFENSEINMLYQGEKNLIDKFKSSEKYDLLIDISIFIRESCDFEKLNSEALNIAKIRTSNKIVSDRKFQTDNLISYQSLISENQTVSEDEEDLDIELIDTIRFFLKSLFRKNNFLPKQLEAVNQALQLKNTLAVLPFASGKTLIYHFVSLLQPGISLIINPVMSLMKEQFDDLKNYGIDGTYYVNSSQTSYYDKLKAIDNFKNGKSLITFVSADRFQTEDFRNILKEMQKTNHYFSYTIVDEAHSLSEWSHNFKEEFTIIPRTVQEYCKTKNLNEIPILAFSGYSSYDVIDDIKTKINCEKEISITENINISDNFHFEIQNIKAENPEILNDYEKVKTTIEIQKQLDLNKKVAEIFKEKENNLLIICYNKKGLLSVETEKNDAIFSKLSTKFKELKIGKFEGVIDDSIFSVGGLIGKNSYIDYKRFNNSELNILVANRTISIGMNFKKLENIIYLNFPISFENFIQTNHRAGRNNEKSNIYIYNNNQKIKHKDIEYKSDNTGNINILTVEKESTIDYELQLEYLRKIHGNRFKHNLIFNEILTEISFPKQLPIKKLNEKLNEEFNDEFVLTSQPGTNPYQLHISKSNKKPIGYIDFKNDKTIVKASEFEKSLAEQILLFTKKEILNKSPKDVDIINWLENENKTPNKEGIDKIIATLKNGEEADLIVGFTNGYVDDLSAIIKKFLNEKFDEDLSTIYNDTLNYEDFKSELLNKHNINLSKLTVNTTIEFKEIFQKVRGFYDTLRVINKLYILKIISDYSIDFSKNEFVIKFSKKEDNEYILSVFNYLKPFTSKERALKVFEEIPNYQGETILIKTINYFNNFWFDFVVDKRLKSLNNLFQIADNKEDNNISEKIKKLQHNYLYKIYDNELTENSLSIKTKNFTDNSFSIIEFYLAEIGNLKNNWKHLYYSTLEYVSKYPENNVLSIINGYCEIILNPDNDDFIDTGLSKITEGFAIIGLNQNANIEDVTEKIEWIVDKIYEQNLDLKKKIEELVILKIYSSWLKLFNKKLLAKE